MHDMRVAPLAGKRIGLLAGWASRKNGGVFEALVGQVELIGALGGEPWVFAARDEFSEKDRSRLGEAKACYADSVGPESLAYAPGLSDALEMARLDCLHLHGIWQASSLVGSRWARAHGRRYVISPHGMLDSWITQRSHFKKAMFRLSVEEPNWRAARIFHALTEHEAADIRRWTPDTQVEIVPNPAPPATQPHTFMPGPHIVYIGRIHEKKNLVALLDGWQAALSRLPENARMSIAGIGADADVADLEARVGASGPSVEFVGPVFGEAKRGLLESARFIVLPSLSEGLPMAILDAWTAGIPTIQTAACHLPEGIARGAALECGVSATQISEILVAALGTDEARWLAMSQAALSLANGPFGQDTIASRWADVYTAAMDGHNKHV